MAPVRGGAANRHKNETGAAVWQSRAFSGMRLTLSPPTDTMTFFTLAPEGPSLYCIPWKLF